MESQVHLQVLQEGTLLGKQKHAEQDIQADSSDIFGLPVELLQKLTRSHLVLERAALG